MMAAWLQIQQILATFYDQVAQLGAVRQYWLLCSGFMTYYNLLGHPPGSKSLPINCQLMGAWTSEPMVVQMLMALSVPIWFVHPSQIVSQKIHVVQFVSILSMDAVYHDKLPGEHSLYQGLVRANHLEAALASPTYADISCIPMAKISDPDDYCVRSFNYPLTYSSQALGLHLGAQQNKHGASIRKDNVKIRYLPCT